jgi:quercetin dioxygenase-like cupin family protein
MDIGVPAGAKGPPLHHHGFDETSCVLEGELNFQLGDEPFGRKGGELAFAPRDVPHAFANLSGAGARVPIVCMPAGFGRHFDRIAAWEAEVDPPPEATRPWPLVSELGRSMNR